MQSFSNFYISWFSTTSLGHVTGCAVRHISNFSKSLQSLFLTWQYIEKGEHQERGPKLKVSIAPLPSVLEWQLSPQRTPGSGLCSSFPRSDPRDLAPSPGALLAKHWSGPIIMEIIRINVIFSKVLLRIGGETVVLWFTALFFYTLKPPRLSHLLT